MVDACAVLQRARRAVRRADRRPGRQGRRRAAPQDRRARLAGAPARRRSARRSCCDEYRRANALCMPCRLLPSDRDGIPNVLVEAMAAGAPVVATERLRHPRAGRARGQRPAGRARRPAGARRRAPAPARRPRAHAPPHAQRPRDGQRALRRRPARPRARRRCSGRRCDHRDPPAPRAAASTSTSTATARWPTPSTRGVFSFAGETRDLGLEPDWLHAPLPDDEEWRIDWVKFYYGLDLADAFRATGDRRYLDAWERLVASFILQVPPDHDPSEVTARRILNWLYAWQRLPEASIGAGARREPARPGDPRPRHAHPGAQPPHARALRAAADRARAARTSCPVCWSSRRRELHANLLADFGEDGVHRERSTHYHMIALRSFVGARENCRRFGVELPRELRRAARARPATSPTTCGARTGRSPRSRTATPATTRELLELAARLLEREELARRRPATRASPTAATSSSARASAT